jgi:AmmeMemoRadiSam system protein A
MALMSLNENQQNQLLELAKASIKHGLRTGQSLSINLSDYADELTEDRATFVTLEHHGQLRGCIGMLQAIRPLVKDVAENAYAAAFRDPRFPPLREAEMSDLALHISILSPSENMTFSSEDDLLSQIRAGVDGLVLQENGHRGTFLPSVWEQLPDKILFLQQLKQKAGLPANYWSDTIKVARYTTFLISHKA